MVSVPVAGVPVAAENESEAGASAITGGGSPSPLSGPVTTGLAGSLQCNSSVPGRTAALCGEKVTISGLDSPGARLIEAVLTEKSAGLVARLLTGRMSGPGFEISSVSDLETVRHTWPKSTWPGTSAR